MTSEQLAAYLIWLADADNPTPIEDIYFGGPTRMSLNFGLMRWVSTIAELRTVYPPANDTPIMLLGYNSIGDKKQVIYIYNTSDSTTDDGGATIKPNLVSGAGRWNLV